MGDIDEASEALVRQLHRELNGLTRSARRADNGPISAGLHQQLQKRRPRAVTTTASGKPEQTSSLDRAAAPVASKQRPVRRQESGASGGAEEDEPECSKPAKKPRSDRAKEPSADERGPAHKQQQQQQREVKEQPAQPTGHRKAAAEPKKPPVSVKAEPEAAPGASGPAADQCGAAAPARTALEGAAAAAAAAVRHRAGASSAKSPLGSNSAGHRSVKCFYAGVRWGITLAPNVLHSRSDLAAALNEAFEGEIVSCGRGERLSVVFMDAEGTACELPSLRASGGKENGAKWRQLAQCAHRVYVRPAG